MITLVPMLMCGREADVSNFVKQPPCYSETDRACHQANPVAFYREVNVIRFIPVDPNTPQGTILARTSPSQPLPQHNDNAIPPAQHPWRLFYQ